MHSLWPAPSRLFPAAPPAPRLAGPPPPSCGTCPAPAVAARRRPSPWPGVLRRALAPRARRARDAGAQRPCVFPIRSAACRRASAATPPPYWAPGDDRGQHARDRRLQAPLGDRRSWRGVRPTCAPPTRPFPSRRRPAAPLPPGRSARGPHPPRPPWRCARGRPAPLQTLGAAQAVGQAPRGPGRCAPP